LEVKEPVRGIQTPLLKHGLIWVILSEHG